MVVAVKYRVKPVNKKITEEQYYYMNFAPSGFQKVNQIWGWPTACIFFFLSEQSQVSGIGQATPKPPEAVIYLGEHHV